MSASPVKMASKYAVPSMYMSCHLSDEVPKSWVSSADGTNALSNLPVAVIVSLVALPRSTFPFAVKVPDMVTLFGSPIWIWLLVTVVSISFVVPAKFNVSVPTVTLSFDPESAPTVSVVSIAAILAAIAFADARVLWLEDTDVRSVSTLVYTSLPPLNLIPLSKSAVASKSTILEWESKIKSPDCVVIVLASMFTLSISKKLPAMFPATDKFALTWTPLDPLASNIRSPVSVVIVFASLTAISILPTSIPPLRLTAPVNVDMPPTVKLVVTPRLPTVDTPDTLNISPTLRFFSTPSPPSITKAPVSLLFDWVVFVISKVLFNFIIPLTVRSSLTLTNLLNVTGPSNCVRIVFDLPPSTTNLSLMITSSKITESLDGSSPVTVAIGASNVLSWPVAELTLLLPIKKSPLLFIPV